MLKNFWLFMVSLFSFFCAAEILLNKQGVLTVYFVIDNVYNTLILMTAIIILMLMIKIGEVNTKSPILIAVFCIFFIFIYLFLITNIINFYIVFEISVIPLIFLVSYWGYSLERVKAIFYIFLFTFSFSFPFLLIVLTISKYVDINMIAITGAAGEDNTPFLTFILLCLILVKIPLWSLHLWLIKAHVEASTEGSIVLASVVLKLAGIAFIKVYGLLTSTSLNYFLIILIVSTALIGATIIALYTIRQGDLKLIVAVSSIVHISFIMIMFYSSSSASYETLLLIIVSHGLISPLIFIYLGGVYEELSSRSSNIIKGALKNIFYVRMIWFLLCTFNIALPLTINFFAELYFFFSSIILNFPIAIFSTTLIFLNGLFNIYLYASLAIGKNKNFFLNYVNTNQTLSYYAIVFLVATFCFF